MAELFVYQPFKLRDDRGAIAVTDDADRHLRDKILAILFTAPGERVNAPRFGVGLNRTVFEGLDELTIAAIEFRIAEGVRRELGDEALIDGVDVESDPPAGVLSISIRYRRRSDRRPRNLEIVAVSARRSHGTARAWTAPTGRAFASCRSSSLRVARSRPS